MKQPSYPAINLTVKNSKGYGHAACSLAGMSILALGPQDEWVIKWGGFQLHDVQDFLWVPLI